MEIVNDYSANNVPCEVLLPLTNLRTLVISRCERARPFLLFLCPELSRSGWTLVCPKLKKLVLRPFDQFEMETVVHVAAERAKRGAPLKSVEIISRSEPVPTQRVVELLKHVSRVETGVQGDDEADYLSVDEDSDEEG